MRVLRRVPERQLAGAALHVASVARVSIALGISRCWMIVFLDHDVGVRERRVDVAAGDGPVERFVAAGCPSCSWGDPALDALPDRRPRGSGS